MLFVKISTAVLSLPQYNAVLIDYHLYNCLLFSRFVKSYNTPIFMFSVCMYICANDNSPFTYVYAIANVITLLMLR